MRRTRSVQAMVAAVALTALVGCGGGKGSAGAGGSGGARPDGSGGAGGGATDAGGADRAVAEDARLDGARADALDGDGSAGGTGADATDAPAAADRSDAADAGDAPADRASSGDGAADRAPDVPPVDAGPTCSTSADCPANQVCLLPAGHCQCPVALRLCGSVCGPEGPTRCGTGCRNCPGTADGDPVCTFGACAIACRAGFQTCSTGCCRGFTIERVDPPVGGGGAGPVSLAFDAAGVPHVAYVDSTNYAVIHAFRTGTTWTLEQINTVNIYKYEDTSVSLAVDGAGDVHVVYGSGSGYDLFYGRRSGGVWATEVLESYASGSYAAYASVAVDAARTVHVAYRYGTAGNLRHGKRAPGGAWVFDMVDTSDSVGSFTSLALDAAGRPRVSYYDSGNADLKYAAWDGSAWAVETVERAGNAGMYSALALDSQGRPRIAYQGGDTDVRYAAWNGSAWEFESAVTLGNTGVYISLALDAAGTPWVSFWGYQNYRPELWHRAGTGWVRDIYTPDDPDGRHTALARDPAGTVELAYTTTNLEDGLDLARLVGGAGGAWTQERIDELGDAGDQSAMVLDSAGHPHVSYFDRTHAEIRYATRDGAGVWTRRRVAAAGGDQLSGVGGYTSIALDGSTRPHIVWYDATAKNLQHGVWNGSTWVTDVVDTAPYYAPKPTLLLDAAGEPRVVFATASGGILYRARSGGAYASETVTTAGLWPSATADASGALHVSYYEPASKQIMYARRTASGWVTEAIGPGYDTAPASDVAVDASGNVHVCYAAIVSSYEALRYAVRSPGGGFWSQLGPSFPQNNVGGNCSIVIDAQGAPHISHQASAIHHSWLTGGSWIDTPIDSESYNGSTSIAIDAQGAVHIAYRHGGRRQLKYARQR